MKRFKRMLTLFLAIMMCTQVITPAFAANDLGVTYTATIDTPTLAVSSEDQTISVTIKANKPIDIDSLDITVGLPDGFSYGNVTNDVLGFTTGDFNKNNGKLVWGYQYDQDFDWYTTDLLAVVEYKVPANTKADEYEIKFDINNITSEWGTPWEYGATVTATLTIEEAAAACDHVGKTYSYDSNGNGTHKVICECGETVTASEDCDGTATCTAKAECSKCGVEHGDLGDHDYVAVAKQDAVHSQTELKAEIAAHYKCSVCKKLFTADTKTETNLDALTGTAPVHADSNEATDKDHLCDVCGLDMNEECTAGAPVVTTVDPTCTKEGSKVTQTFCTECGKELSKVTEPIAAGSYCTLGAATYSWSANYDTCTAEIKCDKGTVHQTETVTTTNEVTTPATCQVKEVVTYYADFTNFEDKSISVTGEVDPDNHTQEICYVDKGENHISYYPCCQEETDGTIGDHTYVDGVCVCEKLQTYTVKLENSKQGAKIVSVNGVAVADTTATAEHGKDLVVVLENTASNLRDDVYTAKVTCDGTEIDKANYTVSADGTTVTILGDYVKGDIKITAKALLKITVDMAGGKLKSAAHYTVEGSTATRKDANSAYGCSVTLSDNVFERVGYTLVGVEGYAENSFTCTTDMAFTLVWECNHDAAHHILTTSYTNNGDTHTEIVACDDCGETVSTTVKDHTWNAGVETTAPKCEEKGEMTYTCTADGCGATYTEEIPATDHDWEIVGYDNRGSTQHYVIYVCKNDSAHTKTETVKHTYDANGLCVCGSDGCTHSKPHDIELPYSGTLEGDFDHYYQWTAPCNGTITVNVSGTNFIADVFINDDFPVAGTTKTFAVKKGDTFRINLYDVASDSKVTWSADFAYSHSPAADDGDCTTAIKCSVCDAVTTEAKTHIDGDDKGHVCDNDGCTVDNVSPHRGIYYFNWRQDDDLYAIMDVWCNDCQKMIESENRCHPGTVTTWPTCETTGIRSYTFDFSDFNLPADCSWDNFAWNGQTNRENAKWDPNTKVMTYTMTVDALGHDYDVSYVDNGETHTKIETCSNDKSHVIKTPDLPHDFTYNEDAHQCFCGAVEKVTITWKIGEDTWTTQAEYGAEVNEPEITVPEKYYSYDWTNEPETAKEMTVEGVWKVKVSVVDYDGNPLSFSSGTTWDTTMKTVDAGGSVYLNYSGDNYVAGHTLYLVNTKDAADKHAITYESGSTVYPTVTVNENTVYQLTKEPNVYSVTWYNADSSKLGATSVTYGETPAYAAPAYPNPHAGYDYTFVGWAESADGEALTELPAVDRDTDYHAIFTETAKTFRIDWLVKDWNGEGTTAGYQWTDVKYGEPINKPTMSWKKEGYIFSGWKDVPETMPAEDIEIYGEFVKNFGVVTWNVDGETFTTNQTFNKALVLPATVPTKTGYTFAGWYTAAEGGEQVTAETIFTNNNDTTVYYAQWTANAYQVTWFANGGAFKLGSVTMDRVGTEVCYDTVIAFTRYNLPTREGHTFAGWNTKADGTGDSLTAETVMNTTDNMTAYYAQWNPTMYSVKMNFNGGVISEETKEDFISKGYEVTDTYVKASVYEYKEEVYPLGVVANVTKEGHEISTVTDQDGNVYNDAEDFFYITKDSELTINWTPAVYKLDIDYVAPHEGGPYKRFDDLKVSYGDNLLEVLSRLEEEQELPLPAVGSKLRWENDSYNGEVTVTAKWEGYIESRNEWFTIDENSTMPAEDMDICQSYSYTGWVISEDGMCYKVEDFDLFGWNFVEEDYDDVSGGAWYYFDRDNYNCRVEDITWLTKDGVEGYYAFDSEGKWMADYTGIYESNGNLYWIENGIAVANKGLVREYLGGEAKYYYFGCDQADCGIHTEETRNSYLALKSCDHWVENNNGLLPKWGYTFGDDGVIVHDPAYATSSEQYEAIVTYENGKFYTIDGVKVHAGMIKIGEDYYYARSSGELVVDRTYYCTDVNDTGFKAGSYTFDEEGKMILNGLVDGYYYVNGIRTYAGLIQIDGYYYYIRSNGAAATGTYWITKNNGVLPSASYRFDETGKMIDINGFVEEDDGIYYYVHGNRTHAGLIMVEDSFYYVRSSGKVVTDCRYWITHTNGYEVSHGIKEGSYEFAADGKMIIPEPVVLKNGIYQENGKLYYYEDGVRNYAGLICYTGSLFLEDGTEVDGVYENAWIYVRSSGELAASCGYWPTKNNGYMKSATYQFDENGIMLNPPV